MTVEQVATRLADYCRNEQFTQALKELYAENAVSIERGTLNHSCKRP
jgi:hypothetical protein